MVTVQATSREGTLIRGHIDRRLVLMAAVTSVYVTILLLSVAILLHSPRLSLVASVSSQRAAHVVWVLPGGTMWNRGIRPGAIILELDHRLPSSRDAGVWQGTEIRVQDASGPTQVSADALRQGRATWPLLALSPLFLLFGTLVLSRSPLPGVGRSAYLLFSSAAMALALAPAADDDQLWANAGEIIAVPLFAYAFARFFWTFPVVRKGTKDSARAAPAVIASALGIVALLHPALYDVATVARVAVPPAYLLLGVSLLVRGFYGTTDRDVRRGLLVLSGGTFLSVLPFVTLSLVPRLLGVPTLVSPEYSILSLALLPACFAYAILRHNVLRIPLLQRWFVHGVVWTALLAAVIALVSLGARTGTRLPSHVYVGLIAMLVVVGAVSVRWLYERLLSIIEPLIFKDSYDYRASVQELSRQVALVGDLDILGESLPETLCRLMNLEFAALLVLDGDRLRVRGRSGACDLDTLLPLSEAALATDCGPSLLSPAGEGRQALGVPLRVRSALVGYLWLGPKQSGEPFRAVDRDLIATLSGHLATLVRNVQLTQDLRLKVRTLDVLNDRLERAREEERARLAIDLHDEPLQSALQLHRQITSWASNGDDGASLALSRELVSQLRRICTATRPSVLDDLGLHDALELLVMDLEARSGVPITCDVDVELTSGELAPADEVMLYRATQEAVNNCLRHASPRHIRVELLRCHGVARLQVSDDGHGFVVPDRLDSLPAEGHLGLAGLQHRVARVGGQLQVRSDPGRGTVVRVDLPLPRIES